MSPTSEALESLARRHGVPVLEATEYFLGRLEIRGGDETAAMVDLGVWIKLWTALKGEPGPQMQLRAK